VADSHRDIVAQLLQHAQRASKDLGDLNTADEHHRASRLGGSGATAVA